MAGLSGTLAAVPAAENEWRPPCTFHTRRQSNVMEVVRALSLVSWFARQIAPCGKEQLAGVQVDDIQGEGVKNRA
jgi:hypothetical protein